MNHSFVTVKGSLSKEKLNNLIIKINEFYFKNVFTVTRFDSYWEIKYYNDQNLILLGITIDNKRKLHLRPSGGNFCGWIETVFQNEIAFALNGMCSCDAFKDRWEPIKNKLPTYRDYWDLTWGASIEYSSLEQWQFICGYFEKYIKSLPDELKQFVGVSPNPNVLPE